MWSDLFKEKQMLLETWCVPDIGKPYVDARTEVFVLGESYLNDVMINDERQTTHC